MATLACILTDQRESLEGRIRRQEVVPMVHGILDINVDLSGRLAFGLALEKPLYSHVVSCLIRQHCTYFRVLLT